MTVSAATFDFLRELRDNNNREWFNANKKRYERDLKDVCLAFIRDFQDNLSRVSPHLQAIAKAQGGSMFRIYRDTRFSKDKTPYKTHVGMHFKHEQGSKTLQAPGLYLGLGVDDSGLGAGMWKPDKEPLRLIRQAIVDEPERWAHAKGVMTAHGWDWHDPNATLKRPPKGFDAEHAHIDDIKRKGFAFGRTVSNEEVLAPDFADQIAAQYDDIAPFMQFLCDAVGLEY